MKILTGIVIAVIALWCGGWVVLSWWADGRIVEAIELQREQGVEIDCQDRAMHGFPFSMGLGCDSVTVRPPDGSQIDTGALRTAASLTSPGEARAEVDGPLVMQMGETVVEADWKTLQIFIDATLDGGFDMASTAFAMLEAKTGDVSAKASAGKVLLTPQQTDDGAGNLEGSVSLDGLTADIPDMASIPPFALALDAMLEGGYRDLVRQRLPVSRVFTDGARGEIRKAVLSFPDGGKLAIAGPLELTPDGLLSGTVKVGLARPEAVVAWAKSVSPALEQSISLLAQSVAGMGTSAKLGEEEVRAIELTIDRGEVRLGFIKLIDLPPLR